MRTLLTIILSLIGLAASAQSPYEDEKFISSVYLQFDPYLLKEYLLSNERTVIQFDQHSKNRIEKELNGILPDNILRELFQNALIDTVEEIWNCSCIINANCISRDSAKKSFNRDILLFSDSRWTTRKKARQEKKQTKAELKRISKIPGIYYFSRPVYNKSKEYALFNYGYSCGRTCGNQCTFLFQKIDGKWTKIGQVNCYIS